MCILWEKCKKPDRLMFESRNPWADWPLKKTPQPLATQPTNNPQPTSWLFNESGTNPPSVKKSFCHYMPCLKLKHKINILTSFPWIQLNTSCSCIFHINHNWQCTLIDQEHQSIIDVVISFSYLSLAFVTKMKWHHLSCAFATY